MTTSPLGGGEAGEEEEQLGELEILDDSPSCVTECAKVMAAAFSASPAYNYIFQGTQEYRREALEWVFQKNLDLMISKGKKQEECRRHDRVTNTSGSAGGGVLRGVRNGRGEIVCCFLWVPASAAKSVSLWEMITAGMWQVPFRFGLSTLNRLLAMMESVKPVHVRGDGDDSTRSIDEDNSTRRSVEKKNYIMLERMVVRPDHQGRGLGSHALRRAIFLHEALELEQEQEQTNYCCCDVHLETQEERNVRFYQKLGWEITQDQDHCEGDPDYKFHSWHMVRRRRKA